MSYLQPHSIPADLCVDLTPLAALMHGPAELALAAGMAQAAGADALHFTLIDSDNDGAAMVTTVMAGVHLPLHLTVPLSLVDLAISLRPAWVCLAGIEDAAVQKLRAQSIRVALAIDAGHEQVQAAADAGACAIQLHATQSPEHIAACAAIAVSLGLRVHLAQGVDRINAADLAALADVTQWQTGQALLPRAIFIGWQGAVGELKATLSVARA